MHISTKAEYPRYKRRWNEIDCFWLRTTLLISSRELVVPSLSACFTSKRSFLFNMMPSKRTLPGENKLEYRKLDTWGIEFLSLSYVRIFLFSSIRTHLKIHSTPIYVCILQDVISPCLYPKFWCINVEVCLVHRLDIKVTSTMSSMWLVTTFAIVSIRHLSNPNSIRKSRLKIRNRLLPSSTTAYNCMLTEYVKCVNSHLALSHVLLRFHALQYRSIAKERGSHHTKSEGTPGISVEATPLYALNVLNRWPSPKVH